MEKQLHQNRPGDEGPHGVELGCVWMGEIKRRAMCFEGEDSDHSKKVWGSGFYRQELWIKITRQK